MGCIDALNTMLDSHKDIRKNPSRKELIQDSLNKKEALPLTCGALATWTPIGETGRSPQDTYIVKSSPSSDNIDWTSPTNIPLEKSIFDDLWDDAVSILKEKESVYVLDRVIGADASYALPTRVVTYRALSTLFADNMFRPVPSDIDRSVFSDEGFTILAIPCDYIDQKKYAGRLRTEDGLSSPRAMIMDMDRRLGLVIGSAYCGTIKKTLFTVMNYLLPEKGILPLHCSANEGSQGGVALFLGLSGTGKTTLSSDPGRALIGDDEHGWSDNGIANFENGCYAKLINLDPEKEPEIHHASFHQADVLEHGSIIENCMVYPDGSWDVSDDRFTENSRVSYLLSALSNVKESAAGGHPSTVVFLTADANGVLPPVARLSRERAMFWFLMGYTSKLAGTETGITDPVSTFSRFFGGPFMARHPRDYTTLFGEKIDKHKTRVFLINTGWTGGRYGVGHRIDINTTRAIVNAAVYGELDDVEYEEDSRFHLAVPKSCPEVESRMLNPRNTWEDTAEYDRVADKLAADFARKFDAAYAGSVDDIIAAQCPGK